MTRVFRLAAIVAFCFAAGAASAASIGFVNNNRAGGSDDGIKATTATGNITLVSGDAEFQRIDPNGSNRNVTLPAVANSIRLKFGIFNSGSANNLVVKDPGGSTLATLAPSMWASVCCDGTNWRVTGSGPTTSGTDFSTSGIKADIVAESTSAAGVTIDGLLLKDKRIDVSGLATTEGGVTLKDNLANAFDVKEGSNSYIAFVTTDNSEAITVGKRITTTDGVTSATRIIGGRFYSQVAAGTAHTDTTDETVLGSTTIPANTLKQGTTVKIRYQGICTATNANDTYTVRLRIGATTLTGTALITTSAVDVANDNIFTGEFTLVARAAPGAAAACVGFGSFADPGAAGAALKNAYIAATNLATNGALLVEVTGDWSAANAGNSARLDVLNVSLE